MQSRINSLNHFFVGAFLVIGIVAETAILTGYSGNIQIGVSSSGIQLYLNGGHNTKDSLLESK